MVDKGIGQDKDAGLLEGLLDLVGECTGSEATYSKCEARRSKAK